MGFSFVISPLGSRMQCRDVHFGNAGKILEGCSDDFTVRFWLAEIAMKHSLLIPVRKRPAKTRRIEIEPGGEDTVFLPDLKALLESSDENIKPNTPAGRMPSTASGETKPYNLD